MKLITLGKVLLTLEDMKPVIKVPEDIRIKAKYCVDKMLAVGRA
jgi:quinolinate synthase